MDPQPDRAREVERAAAGLGGEGQHVRPRLDGLLVGELAQEGERVGDRGRDQVVRVVGPPHRGQGAIGVPGERPALGVRCRAASGQVEAQFAGARRWPCARLVPAVVAQPPPHLGQPGQLATAAQGPVEEVQGGAEVDRDQALQGGVAGVVVGGGADGDVGQLVVLMVRGVGDEVLPGRLTRPASQRRVVPHGVRHDVVEPAHRVQHRDADRVERVPGGVIVEGHPPEHHVNRGRAGPDLPEGLVERACERPMCPVHRVVVDEPVHPVVREVVGAIQGRHPLVPPGPDPGGPEIRTGHPGDDGPQRRMPAGRRGPLRDPVIGVPEHPDGAVRPRLAHDPFERVVAVVDLVDVGNRLSLGAELAPDVLDHERIATLGKPGRQPRHEGVPPALVVGEADEHGRVAVPRREIDVGGQAHAVPGRHHDLVGQGVDRRRPDGHKINRHSVPSLPRRPRTVLLTPPDGPGSGSPWRTG
jgi:hypothetical protein